MKKKRLVAFMVMICMVLTMFSYNLNVYAKSKSKAKLSNTSITLVKGKTKSITLKNYSKISHKKIKKVKWSISNKKVASLKYSGKYRQKCKITTKTVGKATITLKYNEKIYKCKLVVSKKPTNKKDTTEKEKTTEQEQITEKQPTIDVPAVRPTTETTTELPNNNTTTQAPSTETHTTESPTKPEDNRLIPDVFFPLSLTVNEGKVLSDCTLAKVVDGYYYLSSDINNSKPIVSAKNAPNGYFKWKDGNTILKCGSTNTQVCYLRFIPENTAKYKEKDYITTTISIIPHIHTYSSNYSYDENQHWKNCICGEKSSVGNHEWTLIDTTVEISTDGLFEKTTYKYICNVCGNVSYKTSIKSIAK